MMRHYLIRHAEARNTHPDADRELTLRGEEQSRALAAALPESVRQAIDCIEHSPFRRAQQTAQQIRDTALPHASLRVAEGITPEDNPATVGSILWRAAGPRMLVGHNPHMEALVHGLIGTRQRLLTFHKANIVGIELTGKPGEEFPWGRWEIVLLQTADV